MYADSGSKRLCTRHSVRLDQLVDLISERIRYYVQTYYRLDPADLLPQRDTRREALEQERKALTAQLEKRGQALKMLYLDRVAGLLGEEQFIELNQSFLEEKSRLERRLAVIGEELAEWEHPEQQYERIERAQELLKLERVPRELVVGLVEKIEICEKNPETGQQEVRVTWRF